MADVVQKDVPVYLELVGQTRGSQDVEIRARVEGYLDKVAFTEGSFVNKGTLLYLIDPLPLQAALANANANLATAQAKLAKANTDVTRLTPLVKQQAVSQQELDNALSLQDAAAAEVDAMKAAADKASLDLGYTHITSPIDGLVGTTQVKAGNLVGRNESTLLTTVSQVDPILFRAGISESEYLRLGRREAWRAADRTAATRGRRWSASSWPTEPSTPTRGTSTPSSGPSTPPRAPWRSSSSSPTPRRSCGPGSTGGPAA